MSIEIVLERLKKGGGLHCSRCGCELNREQYVSEWDPSQPQDHHYKSFQCECGKKNWLKMNFPGSGHDQILIDHEKEIRSMIKKVSDR